MTILYLAFGIYIVGVALVLFIRPNSMFRPGGWKEFGLSTGNSYTVFPFWMFTILWAIVSYVLATLAAVMFTSVALRSSPTNVQIDDYLTDSMMEVEPVYQPISQAPPRIRTQAPVSVPAMKQPGYYILESTSNVAPKYVYYGTEPPTLNDVLSHSE
jgi:hypothetical protein